jgi:hypothetical protein
MLEAIGVPALIHTRRWDVLGWNATWPRCFPDFSLRAPHDRNLLKILLTESDFHREPTEHDQIARRVLAKARLDYSQSADDPAFDQLIEELDRLVPDFQRYWRSAEITSSSEGVYTTSYPNIGPVSFEHTSYSIESAPQLRLLIFSPADPVSAGNLAKLLEHPVRVG